MKNIFLIVILGIALSLFFSCATESKPYNTRIVESLKEDIVPNYNESEIIIKNEVNKIGWYSVPKEYFLEVYIDNKLTAQVAYDSSERIIVPNGNHTIDVKWGNLKTLEKQTITVNSERIIFRVRVGEKRKSSFVNNDVSYYLSIGNITNL